MMGCVLGTRAARDDDTRRRKKSTERKGPRTQRNGEKIDRIRRVQSQLAASDRRKSSSLSESSPMRSIITVNQQGWPPWLVAVAGDAIKDWIPRRANTFEKLDKIGQGTYSNVYKAKDLITGKIVALKKVRFDNFEPESVKFMAREILVLSKLNHPNVIKLEGLVTSRMSSSLYLVFEYMEHDLAGLSSVQGIKFTESQVKCYMKQLLSGLEHCHNNGVLHRDIKCSNLLIDDGGNLKIADFGLALFYDPEHKKPMTSRVVTLWYRPPELLLGATHYGIGVDLWSAGCILGELLAGKPIMPGRTEVEQLHKIFKLCGSPSEEYWKKLRLPKAGLFKPQQPYKCSIGETFKDFPPSSFPLLETLLAIDPGDRGTATTALNSEFFTSEPFACDPSTLPKYPPSKELDLKLRDQESRRLKGLHGKPQAVDGARRARARDRVRRAVPAPEANAENPTNLDRWRVMKQMNTKSISEKFPPPHQDATMGYPLETSKNGGGPVSFGDADDSFNSTTFDPRSSQSVISTSSTRAGLCGKILQRPCSNQSETTSPSAIRKSPKKKIIIGLILGICFGIGFTLSVLTFWIFSKRKILPKGDAEKNDLDTVSFNSNSGLSAEFGQDTSIVLLFPKKTDDVKDLTISELLKATDNFSQANIVGCGGFGLVYKATLANGTNLAIKKLTGDMGLMEREFKAEVEALSTAQHENLVSLQGYCVHDGNRLLIYSYMENGSLDYWLHEKSDGASQLDWPTRLKIAQGASCGLAYMHQICEPHIVHRDIKSSNILLDSKFKAHVADFGLSRLILPYRTHVTTELVGTLGYIPPEYSQSWMATLRGDVYSFGVVMLELLTGKRPVEIFRPKMSRELVGWVQQMRNEGKQDEIFDPLLRGKRFEEEMLQVLDVACMCINQNPFKRPTIIEIVDWLKNVGSNRETQKEG